jgi:hypothetical protein
VRARPLNAELMSSVTCCTEEGEEDSIDAENWYRGDEFFQVRKFNDRSCTFARLVTADRNRMGKNPTIQKSIQQILG